MTLSHVDITDQAAANSKTITVPNFHIYRINLILVDIVTDATAGARQFTVEIRDSGGNVLFTKDAAATQGPSLSVAHFVNNEGDPAIPAVIDIPAQGDIRFFFSANGAAGDTIKLRGSVVATTTS